MTNKIIAIGVLVIMLCSCNNKSNSQPVNQAKQGGELIEEYVKALDDFAQIMPKFGQDTEAEWAADIVVYKVNGINSPLRLAEKLPMSGQQLSCNFYHKKPLPEGNATNNHQSFLWRTTGVVQEFVPKVPNFFIAKMEPRHPFKGSSGSPLFKGDKVYGILHSGGDDICGFFATAYAVELLYHYTK